MDRLEFLGTNVKIRPGSTSQSETRDVQAKGIRFKDRLKWKPTRIYPVRGTADIILTTICGIPLAMCWGCYFACIAFEHIWEITPCIRAWEINLQGLKKCFSVIVHACLDPYCEATSGLFIAFKGSDMFTR